MRSARPVLLLFLLVALVGSGCKDPAPPDGAITCGTGGTCPMGYVCGAGNACYRDGNAPDAAETPGCQAYCNCMSAGCAGQDANFTDEGQCLSTCAALSGRNLACRLAHCVFARDGNMGQAPDPKTHCPHASGFSPCDKM